MRPCQVSPALAHLVPLRFLPELFSSEILQECLIEGRDEREATRFSHGAESLWKSKNLSPELEGLVMRRLISLLGTTVLLVAVSLVFGSTDPAYAGKGGKGGGGGGGGDPLRLFEFTVSPDDGLIGDLIDTT